jgi:hypothetical protein
MKFSTHHARATAALLIAAQLAACATLAGGTNVLSNERIVAESAGALGLAPGDLALLTRRTEGTNTYATLRAKDRKEYLCVINGGNLLSFGMVNPPICSAKPV